MLCTLLLLIPLNSTQNKWHLGHSYLPPVTIFLQSHIIKLSSYCIDLVISNRGRNKIESKKKMKCKEKIRRDYIYFLHARKMAVVRSTAISKLDLIMMGKKPGYMDIISWNINEFGRITRNWVSYFEQDFRWTIGSCSEVPKEQQIARKCCRLKQILLLKVSHVINIPELCRTLL